jgi:hypothetical protein
MDVKRETIQRVATPTAILVAVPDDLSTLCADTLADGGLKVLKVGHVAAAAERIPVVMPQLVLLGSGLRPEELEAMKDRCVAVGAAVVHVAPGADRRDLASALKHAANTAFIKALRRS